MKKRRFKVGDRITFKNKINREKYGIGRVDERHYITEVKVGITWASATSDGWGWSGKSGENEKDIILVKDLSTIKHIIKHGKHPND